MCVCLCVFVCVELMLFLSVIVLLFHHNLFSSCCCFLMRFVCILSWWFTSPLEFCCLFCSFVIYQHLLFNVAFMIIIITIICAICFIIVIIIIIIIAFVAAVSIILLLPIMFSVPCDFRRYAYNLSLTHPLTQYFWFINIYQFSSAYLCKQTTTTT